MSTSEHIASHDKETAGTPPVAISTAPVAMSSNALTLDFLAWVAARPRSYAEAMEAWRTSCPRFPIWEDAIADGLIRLESAIETPISDTRVMLTPRGRALLDRG